MHSSYRAVFLSNCICLMMSPTAPVKGLASLLASHPNHVPAIISGKCLSEDGKKLLIPKAATVRCFLTLLRSKRLLLDSCAQKARFVIVDSLLPANDTTFGQLYTDSGEDVLNVTVCEENTYGAVRHEASCEASHDYFL
jgi:hypothetical protein